MVIGHVVRTDHINFIESESYFTFMVDASLFKLWVPVAELGNDTDMKDISVKKQNIARIENAAPCRSLLKDDNNVNIIRGHPYIT